jgi:hypothetical protein
MPYNIGLQQTCLARGIQLDNEVTPCAITFVQIGIAKLNMQTCLSTNLPLIQCINKMLHNGPRWYSLITPTLTMMSMLGFYHAHVNKHHTTCTQNATQPLRPLFPTFKSHESTMY